MTRAFVIHLARAEGRRAQARALVEDFPGDAEILDAVDGTRMSPEEIAAFYRPSLHEPGYPFRLRPGELGCCLSHRAAWRRILDEGLDAALILEDDVTMDLPLFTRAVALAEKHIQREGYIQFQVRPLPTGGALLDADGEVRLEAPHVTPLRTSGQMVSRAAAERLLAMTETIDRPVDVVLQMRWLTGVEMSCVWPSGLTDNTAGLGGSTISSASTKSLSERVAREWKRWRYRRGIARLSARASRREGGGP